MDICGCDGFFYSSLDFGRKKDAMIFKEPVLLLRSENISGPAGMALNCGPHPFKFLGTPLLSNTIFTVLVLPLIIPVTVSSKIRFNSHFFSAVQAVLVIRSNKFPFFLMRHCLELRQV